MSTIWRWIRDAIMRKVKLLDLSFNPRVDDEVIRLPPILLTCDSLEVLRLVLQLNSVQLIDGASVQPFLKNCPLLEDFSLTECFSYSYEDLVSYSVEDEDVCISCLNLKTLKVHNRNIGTYTERLLDYSGLFMGHGSVRYWVAV
ncbi:putative leucine-rich repeat domain superfamily [Helianthus anomalus]